MSPHLPISPEQIAESAVGAATAGAAIVHLHAREPRDGRPTQDPARFRAFLPQIAAASDVVVNLTTGGSQTMTVEERLQPALQLRPEVASLNMGTMNFGLYEMLPRYAEWKWDWEPAYLAGSEAGFFRNTLKDIAEILRLCGGHGTRFELECYDIGHLYTAAYMKRVADRLFAGEYQWSVVGAGRHQMSIARQAAELGGHVRVGLEDSLWIDKGQLASSNAQQVTKVRAMLEQLGIDAATPDEARAILHLKGREHVGF
jgi:uncharacterized protein (DUF849 family)